jgi:hypothetical protein
MKTIISAEKAMSRKTEGVLGSVYGWPGFEADRFTRPSESVAAIWTYRTEREISGNNGPKISVSVFCPGNHLPFQPISGPQQGRIREKRAGSCRSGK